MASAQIPSSSQASLIQNWPLTRVSTKKIWTDDWKVQNYLQAISVTVSDAPTIPRATVRWHTGQILHEDRQVSDPFSDFDASGFVTEKPLELRGYFLKIEYLPDGTAAGNKNAQLMFIGRVVEQGTNYGGDANATPAANSIAPLDQEFVAYGLEFELTRIQVSGAYVTNDGTNVIRIATPLIFNEKFTLGLSPLGNRSDNEVNLANSSSDPKAHVFAKGDEGEPASSIWSHLDILNYLLTFYWPSEIAVTVGGVAADAGKIKGALSSLKLPKVQLDGLTLYEAINRLIDRRRGLGWTLRFDDKKNSFAIHVHTVFDQTVMVSDGQQIPANAEPGDINLESNNRFLEASVEELVIKQDNVGDYGSILVEGERIMTCFTVSVADGTLEKAWTTADETAYFEAAGKTSSDTNAKEMNDRERASEKFRHVFTTFRVPRFWDWKVKNGIGGGTAQIANPFAKDNGTIDPKSAAPTRQWGHRIERVLPFKNTAGADEFESEFANPLVFLKHPKTGQYVNVTSPGDDKLRRCNPRASDSEFAIVVNFAPNHAIAKNHWTGSPKPTALDPTATGSLCYDYSTLMATVAVCTDARLHVRETIANRDQSRELVIRVPDAEFWYAISGTVIDVRASSGGASSSELVRLAAPITFASGASILQNIETVLGGLVATSNLILLDHSPILRRIAAMAKVWYAKKRSAVTLTTRQFLFGIRAGSYLRNILRPTTAIDVGTVVSQVTWNFINGTTTVQTDFAEMDFVGAREDLPALHA